MPMTSVKFVELNCVQNYVSFLAPITYNVLLILVSGFFGFKVRKLPANFNESGFIFISVSTINSYEIVAEIPYKINT